MRVGPGLDKLPQSQTEGRECERARYKTGGLYSLREWIFSIYLLDLMALLAVGYAVLGISYKIYRILNRMY